MLYAIPFLFLEINLVSSATVKCVLKLKQIHFVQKLQIFVFFFQNTHNHGPQH